MKELKYACYSGEIIRSNREVYYIPCGEVASLYNLHPTQCFFVTNVSGEPPPGLIALYPRSDGQYNLCAGCGYPVDNDGYGTHGYGCSAILVSDGKTIKFNYEYTCSDGTQGLNQINIKESRMCNEKNVDWQKLYDCVYVDGSDRENIRVERMQITAEDKDRAKVKFLMKLSSCNAETKYVTVQCSEICSIRVKSEPEIVVTEKKE